jgi:uncharacterized membrane protein YphA (DoxX/SURF4 family)
VLACLSPAGGLVVGGITGTAGVVTVRSFPEAFEGLPSAQVFAGTGGFLLGLAGSLVLCGILTSAVDTVYVCYAANPEALQAHRPKEYAEINAAWRAVLVHERSRYGPLHVLI